MARSARVMLEGLPFHVTHRGNHRKRIFRGDEDRLEYLKLLSRFAKKVGMSIWAYWIHSTPFLGRLAIGHHGYVEA